MSIQVWGPIVICLHSVCCAFRLRFNHLRRLCGPLQGPAPPALLIPPGTELTASALLRPPQSPVFQNMPFSALCLCLSCFPFLENLYSILQDPIQMWPPRQSLPLDQMELSLPSSVILMALGSDLTGSVFESLFWLVSGLSLLDFEFLGS